MDFEEMEQKRGFRGVHQKGGGGVMVVDGNNIRKIGLGQTWRVSE